MNRRVLIVEDQELNRDMLRIMLETDYDILEAANGIEAIMILRREYASISAVILDLIMPQMDGFEVLKRMQGRREWSQIPVIVATGTDEEEAEERALLAGAIDYITKPYQPGILKNRLWNTINLREQAAIVNAAKTDALTGLFSRTAFLDQARELINGQEAGYYVMDCLDIDRFNVINDQYGNDKCDEILKQIAKILRNAFRGKEATISRITADHFAILYPNKYVKSKRIERISERIAVLDSSLPKISCSIGRYYVEDLTLDPGIMYDRAMMAKESVKNLYDKYIAVYNEDMRNRILQEQEIISEMNQALQLGQFEVWYQPQFNQVSGVLIGAEALVRWNHPNKGLIAPEVFVPIFEKNGFIYEIDQYVWEQTCILLRDMIDRKTPLIPISVNVSGYDISCEDIVDRLIGLIQKYEIPVSSLRLEITESAFVRSSERIIQVVEQLRQYGFIMGIDDFGSGYTSLKTLKDVPADMVKLDMRFLETEHNPDRGGNILESIVRMARWIGMSVIAEGVEEPEQAEYLKSIGCYNVQGFFYSKPLQTCDYTRVIENKGYAQSIMTTVAQRNSFWDLHSMETLIFNTYVGGACIFEYCQDRVEVIRVNDKYMKVLWGEQDYKTDSLHFGWEKYLTPNAKAGLIEAISQAIETKSEMASEIELCGFRNPGESIFIHLFMREITHIEDRYLFYCIVEDITEQRTAEQQEKILAAQLEMVMENMNSGVSVCFCHEDGTMEMVFANDRYFEQRGYTRQQYNNEINHVTDIVHMEDVVRIKEEGLKADKGHAPFETVYRIIKRDGAVAWIKSEISLVRFEGNQYPLQIAITDDITSEQAAIAMAEEKETFLQMILDNVGSGITATTLNLKTQENLFANEQYYALLGYTKKQYQEEVKNPYHRIHPEDRERVIEKAQSIRMLDKPTSMEFRIVCRDETIKKIRMLSVNRRMNSGELDIQLNLYTDITEESREEERQKELIENLPCGAGIFDITGGTIKCVYLNKKYWELVGREPAVKDNIPVMDSIHLNDRAILPMIIQKIVISKKEQECEIHVLHGDGRYIPFLVRANIMRQKSGKVMLYVTYTSIEENIVTFRRMLPVALETMMAASTDLFFIKDRTLKYVCASRSFARVAGLSDEKDLIGKTDYELFHSDLADLFHNEDQKMIKEDKSLINQMEMLPTEDEKTHHYKVSKYLLHDSYKNIIGIYGVGREMAINEEA